MLYFTSLVLIYHITESLNLLTIFIPFPQAQFLKRLFFPSWYRLALLMEYQLIIHVVVQLRISILHDFPCARITQS